MPMSIYSCKFTRLLPWSLALLASVAAAPASRAGQAEFVGADLPLSLQYQSAIGAYQLYVDAPVQSWPEANERVGQIGGWRAYAREAAAGESDRQLPAADPHSGHHGGNRP